MGLARSARPSLGCPASKFLFSKRKFLINPTGWQTWHSPERVCSAQMHISAKAAFLMPAWVSLLPIRTQGSLALARLQPNQKTCTLLDLCVSSLRRGHA